MMKKIWFLFLLSWIGIVAAYDLPGLREVGTLQILLLPEKVNEPVSFSFAKQDLNGYSGSEAIVFTLVSPTGNAVWEAAIPDDGNTSGGWKLGPLQSVNCTFTPQTAGVYSMKLNAASAVDMQLLFDHATVKNASWGIVANSMRFNLGKLDVFLLLAPNKLGEKRNQTMQIRTVSRSRIQTMTMTADSSVLIPEFDLPPHPGKDPLAYYKFPIQRLPNTDIYELKAAAFHEVVSLQFPQYGDFLLCTEKSFAEKFQAAFNTIANDALLTITTPSSVEEMAFARGLRYQIAYIPDAAQNTFDFVLDLFNHKYHFNAQQQEHQFTAPKDQAYSSLDLSKVPAGKVLITQISQEHSMPLSPSSGKILTAPEQLVWTALPNATQYTVQFHLENTDTRFELKSATNRLAADMFFSRLTPGVWVWQVKDQHTNYGSSAFFTIPEKADTQLTYLYGMIPARDVLLQTPPQEISLRLSGKNANDLDYAKSSLLLNNQLCKLQKITGDTVGIKEIPSLKSGYNTIQCSIVDLDGNRMDIDWGFNYQTAADPVLAHDATGNITFNGLPFYPVIYYGYNSKQPVEKLGFNTLLLNTLVSSPGFDVYLKRNLKVLDSGSVYHGFYSKGTTPEDDVKNFAASAAARHPARLAAWMDEIDVHRSLQQIKDFLALYGPVGNGWRGVCSCNRSLYKTMSDCGDYLMIDYYTFGKNLFALDDVLRAGREAAGEKPLMSLLMGYSISDPELTGFIPRAKDVEYAAFAALRLKVNAIGLYQCGQYRMECYPDAWKMATDLYKKISALTFVTYGVDRPDAIKIQAKTGTPAIRTLQLGKQLYIIAQNSSFTPSIATFKVAPKVSGKVKVLFENRILTMKDGGFLDGFGPADTHVYCMDLAK